MDSSKKVKLPKTYKKILKQYPEFINKEQMYRLCHISKQTARYLLESRLVPSIDTGKITHKYLITTKDIIAYLMEREQHPERYKLPNGWRNGGSENYAVPEALGDMKPYFEKTLDSFPDTLDTHEVLEITGY